MAPSHARTNSPGLNSGVGGSPSSPAPFSLHTSTVTLYSPHNHRCTHEPQRNNRTICLDLEWNPGELAPRPRDTFKPTTIHPKNCKRARLGNKEKCVLQFSTCLHFEGLLISIPENDSGTDRSPPAESQLSPCQANETLASLHVEEAGLAAANLP